MTALRAQSLRPFIPSGPDYAASRRLFAELGFEEMWEVEGFAGFRSGEAQFILQRLDDRTFAEKLILRLNVPDVDAWWREVSEKNLEKAFPKIELKPPTDYPWGREAHILDLAGVCWHVGTTTTIPRSCLKREKKK